MYISYDYTINSTFCSIQTQLLYDMVQQLGMDDTIAKFNYIVFSRHCKIFLYYKQIKKRRM